MLILLLGMGKSNISIASFLKRQNIEFICYDNSKFCSHKIDYDKFCSHKIDYDKFCSLEEYIWVDDSIDIFINYNISMVIKSPGVPPNHYIIKEAIRNNVKIITNLDLFSMYKLTNKIIAITGSNGKSTVVTLVKHLIGDINMCGNIGIPLFDEIEENGDYVLEVSSYMGEYSELFSPNISCLLNLYPHHLSHHGTFENYIKAKENILIYTKEFYIYNYNDYYSKQITDKIKCTKLSFSTNNPNADIYLNGNNIYYKDEIIDISEINEYLKIYMENVLASILIAIVYGIDINVIKEKIKSYVPLSHRLEEVKINNNLLVFNDSKSTNFYALEKALSGLPNNKNILLICGGVIKDDDYDVLKIPTNLKKVLVNGENKNILYKYFLENKVNVIKYDTLNELLININKEIVDIDIILFSPGSESFDQFNNFEERGNFFKEKIMIYLK